MSRRVLRRVAGVIAVAGVVTGLAAAGLANGVFAGFQRRASDALFPSAKTDPQVVVVAMDQQSERTIGLPPWPRSVHAQLAAQLATAGAAAAVWDVVFSTPPKNPADDNTFASALQDL